MARHDRQEIMHTAPHIPLNQCAATLWINVEILLVTLDKQFILAVAVEIGELVALPGLRSVTYTVGCIFGFDQMMINSRTHVAHVNAAEETVPVGIVALGL